MFTGENSLCKAQSSITRTRSGGQILNFKISPSRGECKGELCTNGHQMKQTQAATVITAIKGNICMDSFAEVHVRKGEISSAPESHISVKVE